MRYEPYKDNSKSLCATCYNVKNDCFNATKTCSTDNKTGKSYVFKCSHLNREMNFTDNKTLQPETTLTNI